MSKALNGNSSSPRAKKLELDIKNGVLFKNIIDEIKLQRDKWTIDLYYTHYMHEIIF